MRSTKEQVAACAERNQGKSLMKQRQMYLYRITMKVADMIYLFVIGIIIKALRKDCADTCAKAID